jgi:hypothetical protein
VASFGQTIAEATWREVGVEQDPYHRSYERDDS